MSAVRFSKPETVHFDDGHEYGYVTREMDRDEVLGAAVAQFLVRDKGLTLLGASTVLITETDCWSGCSEYTITSQWSEITISVPDRGYEKTWNSVSEFLLDVAAANPEVRS